ncbi:hypothetical protein CAOG_01043 [Capsaspora owczarzaki ATCC 30864]|uniref:Uncharacterized protein n=1 Tax=Capsaspora owczarzaki (strain ATCC 30864) TaxID=595528 RepID=A0A0D2WJQ4_CAPO3|nr:hypothetical protein CAOG_01043 [Capsaspora owczarzaki ATCC 30864]KJE89608.1 hypothetical protein CAOG_001043 [Capsaspora owczarzaki ATCC 30864]|eukprot:XP_004365914.1 hypothetical protein CAOG_01043 [Capsaspora owczarzaki ATCC 30864]
MLKSATTFGLVLALVACAAIAAPLAPAADPEKPIWPIQFDVPFGLNWVGGTLINNASSHFYYNFDLEAQVIQYDTHCFPLAHWNAVFYPCKLYFTAKPAIYLASPANGIDCCLFQDGVGTVPPNFLGGFNYSGSTQIIKDYYGVSHNTYHWKGIEDFGYWTDVSSEVDVQFQDGPTGVHWNFGNFNVVNQTASIFALPAGNCETKCNFLLEKSGASGITSKLVDPMLKLAQTVHQMMN